MRTLTRIPGILVLGLAVFAAASCTDLTEVPYDQITEENFSPTEDDIGSLLAPAYTPLRGVWMGWYGALDFQGETGDILLTPVRPNGWYDGGTYVRLHEHRWTSTSNGQPNAMWSRAYSGITAANRVIYQIESGVAPISDPDLQTRILSELKALRAYYYYLLLDNFGNIPIVTDFTQTELPQQTPRDEVFDFVVSELTTALPNLAQETGDATYGRMTHWAARALLSRLYLNAEVYTGTPMWNEVISVTDPIVTSGLYSLEADYRDPFARDNDGSSEILWHVPYDEIYARGSNFHMKTLKPELRFVFNFPAAQPWGGSASNPQFIDTYDEDDTRLAGTPDEQGRGGTWLKGPQFTPDGAYGYDFVQHVPNINAPSDQRAFNYGYPVWKYEIYAGMLSSSDVDFPIIRYAEVLMNRAEAMLRMGDAAGAAAIVTQVRQRAFADTDPAKATVTGAELMQGSSYLYGWYDYDGVVKTGPDGTPVNNNTGGMYGGADIQYGRFLDELGWEFAVEGKRRQDLIRFGVFTTKAWFNHVPNGDYRTIFAIPQGALDTNPNLTQNPGY